MSKHTDNLSPRFHRFLFEVDAQLASLGHDGAWINEIRRPYADEMTAHETAEMIAENRHEDHWRSPYLRARREHGTLNRKQQGV